jgi:multidrug efflux pump subunit AcrA (membrane-fusion protein)
MFASSSSSIPVRFWLVMGAFLVVLTLVVVGLQHPPDGIDSDRLNRLDSTGKSRFVGATRLAGVCKSVWIESVRRGTMPLQIRNTGTVVTSGSHAVRVVVSLDAIEGALARVGQAAEMDYNTGRAQGRLIGVFKDGDNGLTRALAEFGADAPEQRPGTEITVTIDAGASPNVLFVGRSAFGRSNSEGTLFRIIDRRSSIADRVRVRYGRVMGSFAEIVDGLNEGDLVILSDMTGYEHVRRIRFD